MWGLMKKPGTDIIDIELLIPHRGRMKLVEKIVKTGENSALTKALVKKSWPLVENNQASPIVCIELVAQTSAIAIGWKDFILTGKSPEGSGWLVGIKEAEFFTDKIPVGAKILTYAKVDFTMDNYTQIKGVCEYEGKKAGKIILQVIKTDEEEN